MRVWLLGLLVVVGLVAMGLAAPPGLPELPVQAPPNGLQVARPSGELIALATTVGDKYQQVTVIDPNKRVMSVYHVELATGRIWLRSVRDIHWDLQMTEFNAESPLPQQIRSLLESR